MATFSVSPAEATQPEAVWLAVQFVERLADGTTSKPGLGVSMGVKRRSARLPVREWRPEGTCRR